MHAEYHHNIRRLFLLEQSDHSSGQTTAIKPSGMGQDASSPELAGQLPAKPLG